MTRLVRSVLALALLVMATIVLPSSRAYADDTSATSRFAACLSSLRAGDLVLLVDESASLKTSDDKAGRVTASEVLMRGLATLEAQAGVKVDVRIDTFATAYTDGPGWTPLNEGTLPSVLQQVTSLRNRNVGTGTDYWLALDGARQRLAEKAAGQKRCQSVVFFTDGALDVDRGPGENDYNVVPRPYDPTNKLANRADRDRANAAATESLCRDGGLADQLRSAGVIIFGIGLQSKDQSNFDLMKGIVTGQSPAGRCGAIQQPTPGDFYLASNVGDMLIAFDQIAKPGTVTEADVCQGDVCPQGAHSFVLDDSVGSVQILATSGGEPPAVIYLIDPAGQKYALKAGSTGSQKLELPKTVGTFQWLEPKSAAIQLQREGSGTWTGQWQIVFVDPTSKSASAKSKTSIRIIGDVRPAWTNVSTTPWRQGAEPVQLTFGLTDGKGQPLDPAKVLGTMKLTVSVTGGLGVSKQLAALDQQTIAQPVSVKPDDLPLDATTLSLALDITTKATTDAQGRTVAGTQLATQRVDHKISVLAPLGYPAVSADPVNFGSVVGQADVSRTVTFTGPGCVWLPEAPATLKGTPDGVKDVSVTSTANSPAACVSAGDGQTATLPLRLVTGQAGNGGLTGEVTVWFAPKEDQSKPRQVVVPFTASFAKPLNQLNFAVAFALAMILGPGIPILLLYLFRYLVAARIPAESIMVTQIPVSYDGTTLMRDGRPLAPQPGDLQDILPGSGRAVRQLALPGGFTLKSKTGANPFAYPYVEVDAPGALGASDTTPAPVGKQHQARLPIAVQNHWVMLQPAEMPPATAILVLLAAASASPQQRQRLYETAAAKARDVFAAFDAIRPAGPAAPQQPFGSAPASGGVGPDPFGTAGAAAPGAGWTGAPSASPFGGAPSAPASPGAAPAGSAGAQGPFGGPAGGPFGGAPTGPFAGGAPGGSPTPPPAGSYPAAPATPTAAWGGQLTPRAPAWGAQPTGHPASQPTPTAPSSAPGSPWGPAPGAAPQGPFQPGPNPNPPHNPFA